MVTETILAVQVAAAKENIVVQVFESKEGKKDEIIDAHIFMLSLRPDLETEPLRSDFTINNSEMSDTAKVLEVAQKEFESLKAKVKEPKKEIKEKVHK